MSVIIEPVWQVEERDLPSTIHRHSAGGAVLHLPYYLLLAGKKKRGHVGGFILDAPPLRAVS